MRNERANDPPVIVAAAILATGRLLACQRSHPPRLAGYWELPGGKVEPGEAEPAALVRECREELAVAVTVGERIGPEVPVPGSRAVLRTYLARLAGPGEPRPRVHAAIRWLDADELDSVPWLPADAPILAALRPLLAGATNYTPAAPAGTAAVRQSGLRAANGGT